MRRGADLVPATLRRWFGEQALRDVFRNTGVQLGGNLTTAALDLVSLALAARALGPGAFGVLVLIQTYVRIVDALINFQSWQAVIKYGADALAAERREDFERLVKFGTLLDAGSALPGFLLAGLSAPFVVHALGWDPEVGPMTWVYGLAILFNLVGTPTAVLRLFGRFRAIAVQRVAVAAVKLLAVLAAFLAGAGMWVFLIVWTAMLVADGLTLLLLSWREMRRRGFGGFLRTPLAGMAPRFPGIWSFVVTTNLNTSIKLGAQESDVLLVGILLDAGAAGIYKVAKQFSTIPARFADPVEQVIYPDMAKLWASGRKRSFRSLILRIGALAGAAGVAIWVFFAVAGGWVLRVTVGPDYVAARGPLLVFMLAVVLFMFGIAFRPAVLSLGHPQRSLWIHLGSTIVYFAVLVVLLRHHGVLGAAAAQVVYQSLWFAGMGASIVLYLRADSACGEPSLRT